MTRRSLLLRLGLPALVAAACSSAREAPAAGLGPLPATFSAILPCADCVGLRHQLNLFPGGGFVLALTYFRDGRDETFYEMGWYTFSADSSELSLATHDPQGTRFAIPGDGVLRLLDRDEHEPDTMRTLDLRREPTLVAIEPRLMMRGSYSYMADAGVFTDCRSGMRFPVVPGPAAGELEKAYLEEKAYRAASRASAGAPEPQPLIVALTGRIASRPPEGLEGRGPMLVVEHFVESFPNESCGALGVTHSLEGTRWVLTRLGSDPVRLGPRQREVFMVLNHTSDRVTGYAGCNRFSGAYTYDAAGGPALTFGAVAATKRACPGPDWESRFLHALSLTQTHQVTGAHLELFDAAGEVLARFEARNL